MSGGEPNSRPLMAEPQQTADPWAEIARLKAELERERVRNASRQIWHPGLPAGDPALEAVLRADYLTDQLREERAERLRRDARRNVDAQAFRQPTVMEFPGTLAESLSRARPAQRWLIEPLWGAAHNLSIEALYKSGKSTLLASAAGSLADGTPFLGFAPVQRPAGAIAVWNCEMDADDFDDYLSPHVTDTARIIPAHLRWRPVPLLTSQKDREMTVAWLRYHGAAVWMIDTWSRLCAWNGIDPIDNYGVARLTSCLDEIKHEAGVSSLAVSTHMPHKARTERSEERGVGAQTFSGWVDCMWRLTRNESGQRFLSADGRKVTLAECQVVLGSDGRLAAIRGDRKDAEHQGAALAVADLVRQRPGLSQNKIEELLMAEHGRNNVRTALHGLIVSHAVVVVPGANKSHLHYIAG